MQELLAPRPAFREFLSLLYYEMIETDVLLQLLSLFPYAFFFLSLITKQLWYLLCFSLVLYSSEELSFCCNLTWNFI